MLGADVDVPEERRRLAARHGDVPVVHGKLDGLVGERDHVAVRRQELDGEYELTRRWDRQRHTVLR